MNKPIRTALGLTALLLLLGACTSTTVNEYRQGATGIEAHESVVVLGRRQGSQYETDINFVSCIGNRIGRGSDGIKVVPEQEFIDAMFPWFEPRTAPLHTAELERLMAQEAVSRKIKEFGIRYIIWVDGHTETTESSGSMSCTVSPAGGGCFGFSTWEDDSTFEAKVWDVGSLANVGTISAGATGQSYMPALIVPIPLIARVEAKACSRLGSQLKQFVRG